MKISQGRNLAVGLHDKDEFGPSPDGTVSTIREFSNVPGLKNPFVFLLNGPEKILTVEVAGRRVPQPRGPDQSPTDRRTLIGTPNSNRRDQGC